MLFCKLPAYRLVFLFRGHSAEEIFSCFDDPLWNVHFLLGLALFLDDRQNAFVFQENHRLFLGLIAFSAEIFPSYNPAALFRIQIGIFKKAAPEYTFQKPYCRLLKSAAHGFFSHFFASNAVCLQNGPHIRIASKLIHAIFNGPQMPFCLGKVFHAIAPASKGIHFRTGICGNAPVGTHHAIVTIFFPEQIMNQIMAVGISHVLMIFFVPVPGHSIIRHHCRCTACGTVQLKNAFCKGFYMIRKVLTRIHCIFSKCIVGISSRLAGAASRPVFCHGAHAVFSPSVLGSFGSLQSVTVNLSKPCHLVRIGTESILKPHPSGLCGQVYLWGQGCGNAKGTVFCRNCFTEFFTHFV